MHMKYYHFLNKDFKNDLGLHQYAPLSTNALQIDIKSGSWNGKVEAIRTGDVSKVQNFFIKSGTVVALNAVISAAWLIGYVKNPTGILASKLRILISDFTVGFLCNLDTVTRFI